LQSENIVQSTDASEMISICATELLIPVYYTHKIRKDHDLVLLVAGLTRKLSYRKADRAMRPIYMYMGARKIFGCPWLRPRLLSRTS